MVKKLSFLLFMIPLAFMAQEEEMPKKTGTLPVGLEESSGIETAGNGTFYTHNDGDGDVNLYKIDKYGKMEEFITIENVEVTDIEDIARDEKGNIYLGDFGNNKCDRKRYKILKMNLPENSFSFPQAKEIVFTLPDNTTTNHTKSDRNFDIEAMFHHKGWLYVFTRDRSEPSKGYSKMYKVPDDEGRYEATYIGKIMTDNDNGKGVIRAADISPNGENVVLLAKEGLYYLSNFTGDNFHQGMKEYVPFTFKSQKEAVVYVDDCMLAITDEYAGNKGGRVYEMDVCTEVFKLREEKLKK